MDDWINESESLKPEAYALLREAIDPMSLRSLQSMVPSTIAVNAVNIVGNAASRPNRKELLIEIIDRFPGERIGELARGKLEGPGGNATDDLIRLLNSQRGAAKQTKGRGQGDLTSSVVENHAVTSPLPDKAAKNGAVQDVELILSASETWYKYTHKDIFSKPDSEYIPLSCWTRHIRDLDPLYVYNHRGNIAVVLNRKGDIEEGKYIRVSLSSYMPSAGAGDDGFVFNLNPENGNPYNGVFDFKRNRSKASDIQSANP